MEDKKKNVHAGHRQRLLDTILEAGIDKVSNIQALEYILTYVIPRCDTNELAHRLLERFGTAADVINTDWELLAEVEGMGETSAKKLHLLVDIFEYYTEQQLARRYVFEYRSDISDYFEELLRFKPVETTYIVAVNAANRVTARCKLGSGGIKSVGVSMHQVAKFVTSAHPTYIFLAHNHPGGKALPSEQDYEGTNVVRNLLSSLNIPLADHIIVGIDGVYSMEHQTYFREFRKF